MECFFAGAVGSGWAREMDGAGELLGYIGGGHGGLHVGWGSWKRRSGLGGKLRGGWWVIAAGRSIAGFRKGVKRRREGRTDCYARR